MSLSRVSGFFNWSVRIGRLFGIPIHLHITLVFFLLPVLTAWRQDALHAVEYAVAIVLCILLHELGHALTAKHYKLTGLSIALHGFGGFATSSGYRNPTQALLITLAGPAVTFAIGLLLLGIGVVAGPAAAEYGTEAGTQLLIIDSLGRLNILLGFLNLIPSLPFDGGHAVQALLSRKKSEFQAMRDVAHLGLLISPVVIVGALIAQDNFIVVFGLMGLIASFSTASQTGGIRMGEALDQSRKRKEESVIRDREREKHEAYKGEVYARQKAREERERLRKLLDVDADD